MPLTFAVERWPTVAEELRPLIEQNWRETALDHEVIPLDVDWQLYADRDAQGVLHITTARNGDKLVGYFVTFVVPHPHYKSTIFALMDAYFLAKEHRKATNGLRLFAYTEAMLKACGVTEVIANSKVKHDMSAIFDRLGWRRTAITYSKLLTS